MGRPQLVKITTDNTNKLNEHVSIETPTNSFSEHSPCAFHLTPKSNMKSKTESIALIRASGMTKLSRGSPYSHPLHSMPKKSMSLPVDYNPASANFEAFSLNFHLPLKIAAEKFGVRATAFKKRCRAIGIRHWPYRKVRSLRRSLQELSRCKEQGTLSDKQQYQLSIFKKQLDRLMAPETYGIDPSGRITVSMNTFDSDEFNEDSQDEEMYPNIQSPSYGATLDDCTISPAEGDKSFGDFSALGHLRSFRKESSAGMYDTQLYRSNGTHTFKCLNDSAMNSDAKDKLQFTSYDHYLHASDPQRKSIARNRNNLSFGTFTNSDENAQPSTGYGYDLMTNEFKYDVRSLADDSLAESHGIDYASERFFDDVFLQISPDYGCLV